jgi:hypothetical protein
MPAQTPPRAARYWVFLLRAARMQANTNLADLEQSVQFVKRELLRLPSSNVVVTSTSGPFLTRQSTLSSFRHLCRALSRVVFLFYRFLRFCSCMS